MAVRVCLITLNTILLGICGLSSVFCFAITPAFESGNEDKVLPWCAIAFASLFSTCVSWAAFWSTAENRPTSRRLLIGAAIMTALFGSAGLGLLLLANAYAVTFLAFALLPLANVLLLHSRYRQQGQVATT